MSEKTGKEALKETVAKLKGEAQVKKQADQKTDLVRNESKDSSLALSTEAQRIIDKYNNYGSQEDQESIPTLKLHSIDSINNKLPNGKEPEPGQYFYSGTSEAFDAPLGVHIISARSGFFPHYNKTKNQKVKVTREDIILMMKKNNVTKEDEIKTGEYFSYQMVIAGVIHGSLQPFMMYLSGNGAGSYFDYIKDYKPFKNKGIPKWMLTTLLTSKAFPSVHGKDKIAPVIWIKRFENGDPVLELTDKDILYLEDKNVFETLENSVMSIISNSGYQSKREIMDLVLPKQDDSIQEAEEVFEAKVEDAATVKVDEIPF